MKKVLSVALSLMMIFAFTVSFTGCGSNESSSDAVKVGCIYIGSMNDGGFTQVMHESLQGAADKMGNIELIENENTGDSDKQTVKDVATNMIDQGATIIVGCSYGFGEALDELAGSGDYDDITFLHFSGPFQNETNMENFFGSMEQARYLSGMACAAASKTGKLGYVAAHPFTEVQIGINAFTLGAQAINPDVEVQVVYINSWGDAELEKSAAEQLIAAGCDALTYHADSTATQVAAQEAGVFATGWNSKNNACGENYVTSAYWDFTNYFAERFEQIIAGEFKPTGTTPFSTYGSMEDGMVNIDEFGAMVPEKALEKINAAKEKLASGDLKVFSGAINYNDGKVLCKDGQDLTDKEIWAINGVIKGVTATDVK